MQLKTEPTSLGIYPCFNHNIYELIKQKKLLICYLGHYEQVKAIRYDTKIQCHLLVTEDHESISLPFDEYSEFLFSSNEEK